MLAPDDIERLRADLVASEFTLDAVPVRLGDAALAGLGRNSTMPAAAQLGEAEDRQADAIRLWLLQQPVPAARLQDWESLPALRDAGLVEGDGLLTATVELKPHGSERSEGWICSDQTPLDGRGSRPRTDFVLGASPASTTLSQLVPPRHVGRAMDLGTGCGIQSLHLNAEEIVATDLNPRALELARISLGLSGVPAELRTGSLYGPVAGERFDLIVTNPPYVISPPSAERLVYREGTFAGDGLMREVVTGAASHLKAEGLLVVLGNWAVTSTPWQERLAEWLRASGGDALVLQRELLDPYEYIELWLADAGLTGTAQYSRRYADWLDYFAANDIRGVGMGWLALRNTGRADPEVRIEEWPHAVHQPVGAAFADFFDAIGPARLPDTDMLSTRWRVRPGVVQETIGLPGAADPQHLVLRQQYGFGRAVEAGTALAAVVGACDGELPLGILLGAVAGLLDADPESLRDEVLDQVRTLVLDGYLLPG
jgi:methylase of polypeptide subunit release factors